MGAGPSGSTISSNPGTAVPREKTAELVERPYPDYPAGTLVDVIASDGRIAWANEVQCAELGYGRDQLVGLPATAIYEADSFDILHGTLERPPLDGVFPPSELKLVRRTGRPLRTIATGRLRPARAGGFELELSKLDLGPLGQRLEQMEADNRLLRAILDDATEAHWTIEFTEPVDITQGADEVIRQVFENQSVWRLCNRAMARLYELPEDLDLNEQSVRLYWPRSQPNEAFVRRLLETGFHLDGAISVDRRHDGTDIVIENDVRADVGDGFLYRIRGNCRNVNARLKSESAAWQSHAVPFAIPKGR